MAGLFIIAHSQSNALYYNKKVIKGIFSLYFQTLMESVIFIFQEISYVFYLESKYKIITVIILHEHAVGDKQVR